MPRQQATTTCGLLQVYGEHSFQTGDDPQDSTYRTLPQRLANLRWELADPETGVIEGLKHQALAGDLGSDRFTVSALLREFKRNQYISLGYRRIQILHSEAMSDLA